MTSTHYLIVQGHLPSTVAQLIDQRSDDVRVCRRRHQSVLECRLPDESALRALVTQLWDVDARLLRLVDLADASERGLR